MRSVFGRLASLNWWVVSPVEGRMTRQSAMPAATRHLLPSGDTPSFSRLFVTYAIGGKHHK